MTAARPLGYRYDPRDERATQPDLFAAGGERV